jgi:hypothetical protein
MPSARRNEMEADALGLMLLSRAGFKPQSMLTAYPKVEAQAIKFLPPGQSHLDFPERKEEVEKLLPLAMEQRKKYIMDSDPPPITHWYTDLPKLK